MVLLIGGTLAVAAGTWFTLWCGVDSPVDPGSVCTPVMRMLRASSRPNRLTPVLPPTDLRVRYRESPATWIRGLDDADPGIRSHSAWQLKAAEPTAEALVPLAQSLQDRDGDVRKAAAAALGEYAELPPWVAQELRRLVRTDPLAGVSVRALWAIAGRRTPGVLEDAMELYGRGVRNSSTGERSAPMTVLDAIARESPDGYRFLRGLLADPDPEARRSALQMMPTCGEAWPQVRRSPEFLPAIEGMLTDTDTGVRSSAAWALECLKVR